MEKKPSDNELVRVRSRLKTYIPTLYKTIQSLERKLHYDYSSHFQSKLQLMSRYLSLIQSDSVDLQGSEKIEDKLKVCFSHSKWTKKPETVVTGKDDSGKHTIPSLVENTVLSPNVDSSAIVTERATANIGIYESNLRVTNPLQNQFIPFVSGNSVIVNALTTQQNIYPLLQSTVRNIQTQYFLPNLHYDQCNGTNAGEGPYILPGSVMSIGEGDNFTARNSNDADSNNLNCVIMSETSVTNEPLKNAQNQSSNSCGDKNIDNSDSRTVEVITLDDDDDNAKRSTESSQSPKIPYTTPVGDLRLTHDQIVRALKDIQMVKSAKEFFIHDKAYKFIHSMLKKTTNKCPICLYRSSSVSALMNHALMHTINLCRVCNKAFQDVNIFVHHILKHTGERSISCSVCGISKLSETSIRMHIVREHNGHGSMVKITSEIESGILYGYTCPKCGLLKLSRISFIDHVKFSCQVWPERILMSQPTLTYDDYENLLTMMKMIKKRKSSHKRGSKSLYAVTTSAPNVLKFQKLGDKDEKPSTSAKGSLKADRICDDLKRVENASICKIMALNESRMLTLNQKAAPVDSADSKKLCQSASVAENVTKPNSPLSAVGNYLTTTTELHQKHLVDDCSSSVNHFDFEKPLHVDDKPCICVSNENPGIYVSVKTVDLCSNKLSYLFTNDGEEAECLWCPACPQIVKMTFSNLKLHLLSHAGFAKKRCKVCSHKLENFEKLNETKSDVISIIDYEYYPRNSLIGSEVNGIMKQICSLYVAALAGNDGQETTKLQDEVSAVPSDVGALSPDHFSSDDSASVTSSNMNVNPEPIYSIKDILLPCTVDLVRSDLSTVTKLSRKSNDDSSIFAKDLYKSDYNPPSVAKCSDDSDDDDDRLTVATCSEHDDRLIAAKCSDDSDDDRLTVATCSDDSDDDRLTVATCSEDDERLTVAKRLKESDDDSSTKSEASIVENYVVKIRILNTNFFMDLNSFKKTVNIREFEIRLTRLEDDISNP